MKIKIQAIFKIFTKNKTNAQPPVENHKDQHKKIGDGHLNKVEKSLK